MGRPKGSKNGGEQKAPVVKDGSGTYLDGVVVPEGVKEAYVTEDGQVFFRKYFADKHAANKKLKIQIVKV